MTTINHSYTLDEVVHQLRDSGAKYMVTTIDLLPTATKAAEICGIAPDAILLFGGADDATSGKRAYQSVYSKRLAVPVKTDMDDIAYLCYSSGTTGNVTSSRSVWSHSCALDLIHMLISLIYT